MKSTKTFLISAVMLGAVAVGLMVSCSPAPQQPVEPAGPPKMVLEPGKQHYIFAGVTANFPRIAAWLFQGFFQSLPRGTFRGDIMYIGDGAVTATRRICDGQAHFTITTPAAVAFMFHNGVGLADKPCPQLRGVFKMPQRDPLILAVRADMGITSFEEAIAKKIPIKMATVQDSVRAVGWLYPEFLKAYGTTEQEVESWGGKRVGADLGGLAIQKVMDGEANFLLHEGDVPIAPNWKELNAKIPMRILTISDDVIAKLSKYGFTKYDQVIRKGAYPGALSDVTTMDYSDWIVLADASVPDDIAYLMAKIAVERKADFENQYRDVMLPAGSKEMGQYIADPKMMWRDLGAPLHPGAEKYFKEKGLMD
jgi:TRAP-type uncharacterized transport system substrate-binding protein